MTLTALKRILLALLFLVMILAGIWLVVTNPQTIRLNLLLVEVPAVNSGVVIVVSFIAGCLCGLLAAVFIFRLLPLRWQLRQFQRELTELRRYNARPPTNP